MTTRTLRVTGLCIAWAVLIWAIVYFFYNDTGLNMTTFLPVYLLGVPLGILTDVVYVKRAHHER